MKAFAIVALALVCVVGLTSAQFGFSPFPAPQTTSGFPGIGQGGLLALFGFFILFLLLISSSSSSSTPTITIVNATG